MKAAVFSEIGSPLRIEEVPDPEPGRQELLVRVKSCGICGSDLHVSETPPGLPCGTIFGHEFAGEVVEVGADIGDRFVAGDRVTALPCISCGRCPACLAGDVMQCPSILATGLGGVPGAFAEYVRVGLHETLKLPDSVDYHTAALVEPLSVGLHAVERAKLAHGDNVLVLGAGPIGLAVSLWARFFGARRVVVSERSAGRRDRALEFGATGVIDAANEDVGARFLDQTGAAPDVVFECVGLPGLLMECVGLARQRGRVVVAGVCMQPDTILPVMATLKEIELVFVLAYYKRDFAFTLDMLDSERIRAREMITQVVGLDALPETFEALKRPGSQCKVLLAP